MRTGTRSQVPACAARCRRPPSGSTPRLAQAPAVSGRSGARSPGTAARWRAPVTHVVSLDRRPVPEHRGGPGTRASTTPPSATSTPSAASDVTPRSAMPHGTMCPNMPRSVVDIEGDAVQRTAAPRGDPHVRTPMAAILRGVGPVRVRSTRPGTRPALAAPGKPTSRQRVDDELARRGAHARARPPGAVGTVTIGIGHQLTRAVIGDVATPVGLLELGADRRRDRRGRGLGPACTPSV